jgi:hypothetical protein
LISGGRGASDIRKSSILDETETPTGFEENTVDPSKM